MVQTTLSKNMGENITLFLFSWNYTFVISKKKELYLCQLLNPTSLLVL